MAVGFFAGVDFFTGTDLTFVGCFAGAARLGAGAGFFFLVGAGFFFLMGESFFLAIIGSFGGGV